MPIFSISGLGRAESPTAGGPDGMAVFVKHCSGFQSGGIGGNQL